MKKLQFLKILLIISIFVIAFPVGLFLGRVTKLPENNSLDNFSLAQSKSKQCQVRIEEKIVRGGSLSPLIKNGQKVKFFANYYNCHEIQRGDVVLYSYAGDNVPLIKIIRGVPGDSFALKQASQGTYLILINGEILKNSEDKPYLISGKKYQMLALYERDYRGRIPADTYLLLGNIPSGTIDSTRFGLIGREGIMGKVEY